MFKWIKEFKMVNILMVAIIVLVLYNFMSGCRCNGNGFTVGACQGLSEQCNNDCCENLDCLDGYCIDGGPSLKKCKGVLNPKNECESNPKCSGCKECDNTYITDDNGDNYRQCSHDDLYICTSDDEPCDPPSSIVST